MEECTTPNYRPMSTTACPNSGTRSFNRGAPVVGGLSLPTTILVITCGLAAPIDCVSVVSDFEPSKECAFGL